MKVLYLNTLNLTVAYFRMENPASALVRQGKKDKETITYVEYFVSPDYHQSWEQILYSNTDEAKLIYQSLESAFKYFDVIVTQRYSFKQTVDHLLKLKKEYNTKLFLELDDSLEYHSQSALSTNSKEIVDVNRYLATKADGIICATSYLAESLKKFNNNVHICRNFITNTNWKFNYQIKPTDEYRIGYAGASGHDQDLETIWPELMEFLDKNKDAKLVIRYGGYKPDFIDDTHPQIDYKNISCHISKYPQKYENMKCHCMIAPLRDLEFNRCKSELKVLEAFTHGIPIVASDMECYNNDHIKKLENKGMILAKKGEWVNKLQSVKDSRQKVETKYMKKLYSPAKFAKELLLFFDNTKIVVDEPIIKDKYEFLV